MMGLVAFSHRAKSLLTLFAVRASFPASSAHELTPSWRYVKLEVDWHDHDVLIVVVHFDFVRHFPVCDK
jgi:hypothetical protein